MARIRTTQRCKVQRTPAPRCKRRGALLGFEGCRSALGPGASDLPRPIFK
jgi:hypothetical protein